MSLSVPQLAEIAAEVFTKGSVSVSGQSVSVIYRCGHNKGFNQSFERKRGLCQITHLKPLEPIEILICESEEVSFLLSYSDMGARAVLTFSFDETHSSANDDPVLISINDSETKYLTDEELAERTDKLGITPSREPYHFSKEFRLALATGRPTDEQYREELEKVFEWIEDEKTQYHTVDFQKTNRWKILKSIVGKFSNQWELEFSDPEPNEWGSDGAANLCCVVPLGRSDFKKFSKSEKKILNEILQLSDGLSIEGSADNEFYFLFSFEVSDIYTE